MTTYMIHAANGQAVSIGSVIADPLPAGLTAVALSASDAVGLRDGSKVWESVTRSIVPAPVDVIAANRATIEARVPQAIIDLQTIAGSAGTLTTAQLSNGVRTLAKALLWTMRHQFGKLDSAD